MIHPLGAQSDAGAVVQPQTATLWLLPWHFQPLAPPQALDPLVVDHDHRVREKSSSRNQYLCTVVLTGWESANETMAALACLVFN